MIDSSSDLRTAVLSDFFQKGERVCLLPRAKSPRLFFRDGSIGERWADASFYPAFSLKARLLKGVLRKVSAAGFCFKTDGRGASADYKEFLSRAGFEKTRPSVMIGTPGLYQKAIAKICEGRRVVGYLKYGFSPSAKLRIQNEAELLRRLPEGIGPAHLADGALGHGEALLMAPLSGQPVFEGGDVSSMVLDFLVLLESEEAFSFSSHPWVESMRAEGVDFSEQYPELARRKWKSVIMHGDFAPWNLVGDGMKCRALDWESGTVQGFPLLDLAHYCIQSSLNLYNRSAQETLEYTVKQLTGFKDDISQVVARDLVRLCVQWIVFRDHLDLSGLNSRSAWYCQLISAATKEGNVE